MSFIRRSGRHAVVLAGVVITAASFLAASAQASPHRPALDNFSVLRSVYCTAAANCWAVGFQGEAMQAEVNRVLHWNGHSWSRLTVPNPGGSTSDDESRLAAVRA